MDKREKTLLGLIIELVIYILRWLTLAMAVVMGGLTIGLIAVAIIKTDATKGEFVAKMMNLITYYSKEEVLVFIKDLGIAKVVMAGVGYGLAYTVKYIAEYVILNNMVKLIDELVKGKIYTEGNVIILNKTLPYTLLATFIQPIVLYITTYATTLFTSKDYDVSNLMLFFIVYIFKVVFEKGLEISKKNQTYGSELSSIKADQSELKMELLRREAEIKELKEYKEATESKIKELNEKQAPVKKTAAKKAVKAEEVKPAKKTAAKKAVKAEEVKPVKKTASKKAVKAEEEKTVKKTTAKKSAKTEEVKVAKKTSAKKTVKAEEVKQVKKAAAKKTVKTEEVKPVKKTAAKKEAKTKEVKVAKKTAAKKETIKKTSAKTTKTKKTTK